MSSDKNTPLEWICLQLIPLEGKDITDPDSVTVWWNPDKQKLAGDNKEVVEALVEQAMTGGIEMAQGAVEITEPLGKPSQLAAILAQKYWVVPTPVENVGDLPEEVQ